jgi:RNA polymerase sigma-70 factor (ECF subfamily)
MNHGDAPSIPDLLALARGGDSRKREELFQACREYLNQLARGQLEQWMQGKVDASDIVQQTLLEAYRDFEKFQGDSAGEWAAWLRCILERNAADFIRHYRGTAKRNTRREIPLPQPGDGSSILTPGEPPALDATPSQEFLHRDEEQRMVQALRKLSVDHRQVIELRNLQRLPFDEVAEKMHRSRPAAQMLWKRAIEKLQEILAE